MRLKNRRQDWRSRRGMASALIIMILVLLIFFGVLGLVASAADLRLAQKRADWNQQFYLADAGATQLYADLDQFLAGQGENLAKEQDARATALDQWLVTRQDVREYRITSETGGLVLYVLTTGIPEGQQAKSQQGIAMTLLLRAGSPAAAGQGVSLEIKGWQQWQMPFDYNSGNGGVWEG